MVGAERFELSTFCSQSRRASQTALCPELKNGFRLPVILLEIGRIGRKAKTRLTILL